MESLSLFVVFVSLNLIFNVLPKKLYSEFFRGQEAHDGIVLFYFYFWGEEIKFPKLFRK